MQKNVLKRDTENVIIVVVSHVWLAMSNRYTGLEEKCPLLGDYCNQEEKDCDKCINQEKAWQDIQCYIECHDYGISCGFLEKYYNMYRYYNRKDIDYVVERFGEPAKEKEFINVRKTGHFQDFVDGIIEKQKTAKRSELLAAITDFWNAWKSTYSEVIIGTGGEYDYEYIEEENGKFTSSLLDGEYDSFDEIVKDFCKVVDPDDVAGFNYGKRRVKEQCEKQKC